MDTTGVPLGERALRSVLKHVVEAGDEAERSFLEVKREIDLQRRAGIAKVAKFLLGVANREPRAAARYFQGHSVLVLGAEKGQAPGIPRGLEFHELEDKLRPYLGVGFPPFELGRLAAGPDREVLFVVGAPPQQGQPPFPCRKAFEGDKQQEHLQEGAIYVRGQSNTRPATAGEIDMLIERARTVDARPEVNLDLQVRGQVHRVGALTELMNAAFQSVERQFRVSLQERPVSRTTSLPGAFYIAAGAPQLTADERRARLQEWKNSREMHTARGSRHLLGVALAGMQLAVTSPGRFLDSPRLTVVFHECQLVDYLDHDDFDYDTFVEPVLGANSDIFSGLRGPAIPSAGYPIDWENSPDGAVVTLTPAELHPDTPWVTDDDDYCVVAPVELSAVRVSWTLSERGNDRRYSGEQTVETTAPRDARWLYSNLSEGA